MLSRVDLDIADPAAVTNAIDFYKPWGIVNAAGYVRVDDAESEIDKCRRDNVDGPCNLAYECARRNLPLVTFSSDLVFMA
ncbi:MAG: sugar nucleotide-binding protein [Pyrinomonadaceae bacterium]